MNIWFSGDPHLGHWNIVNKFKLKDGSPARKFQSIEEHDEIIIAKHNDLVKPGDVWVCIGDVAMDSRFIDRYLPRMHGTKFLVRGNHDTASTAFYLKHFQEVDAMRVYDSLLFTHIPIAPWSFGKKITANVHGHVHMSEPLIYRVVDPRGPIGFCTSRMYVNLSLERTQYRPVSLEEVKRWVKDWSKA